MKLILLLATIAQIGLLVTSLAKVYAKQQIGKTQSQLTNEFLNLNPDQLIGCFLNVLLVVLGVANAYILYYALSHSVGSKVLAFVACALVGLGLIVGIVKQWQMKKRARVQKQLGLDPVLIYAEDLKGEKIWRFCVNIPLILYLVYLCALIVFGVPNFVPLP